MGWQDLLAAEPEEITLPWAGGRRLSDGKRSWKIKGKTPKEHGWYVFAVGTDRTAKVVRLDESGPPLSWEDEHKTLTGYLAGSRFVADDARVDPDPAKLVDQTEQVYVLEQGLERFTRAVVTRLDDRLYYIRQEFPNGPEFEVQAAFQDRRDSLDEIKDVTPALDLTFRWESHQRELEEERERLAAEKAEAKAALERALKDSGTGAGRRALAQRDFKAAAKASLLISGAEYLDHRVGGHANEMVVQYKFRGRRLECVCQRDTLRIIDGGVCLDNHRGTKGDTFFTLESLPAVIGEAMDRGRLVVWRHLDGRRGDGYEWDEERW
jgi:hypothetical protein